jgi:protein dithiol oxidoreductase (disulfide-forming)
MLTMRLIARPLLAPLFALLALSPLACSAAGDAASYEEGTHYKRVREVSAPADPKRIVVNEFFWYGCSHCAAFEPVIQGWAKTKPADVDFVQVPNSLGRPIGMLHAKAFYAADSLGVLAKTHEAMFDAIHNKHNMLETDDQLAAFFNQQTGVLPDVFKGTLNGFAVDSRFRNAEALTKQFGVASTPVIVVGGRYLVDARMAGGFDGMIKITNHLIEKVRKDRKKG